MASAPSAPPNLDPDDWQAFRVASRRALDDMIDFLQTIRERPVWQQAPAEVVREFRQPLPAAPQDLDAVLADFSTLIRPYATGNLHPLFMGWVHGAGTPVGMLAEMLAAGLNANCGGRNHIALDVERQIAAWAGELFGFPADASGVFVTGTSAANHLALLIARNAGVGDEVRRNGLRDTGPQLVAYTSVEAHGCIKQAMEMAGIGSRFLRLIGVDARGAMRADLLADAIAADRAHGLQPFLVAGTAGTVNTGAFDDLDTLADICRRESSGSTSTAPSGRWWRCRRRYARSFAASSAPIRSPSTSINGGRCPTTPASCWCATPSATAAPSEIRPPICIARRAGSRPARCGRATSGPTCRAGFAR